MRIRRTTRPSLTVKCCPTPALPTWLNPPRVAQRADPSGRAVETALPNRVRRQLQEVVGYKNQNAQSRSIFSAHNSLSTGVAIRVRDSGAGVSDSVKARMLRRPAHPQGPAPAPRGTLCRRRRNRRASHAPRRARTMPAPSRAPVPPLARRPPPPRPSRRRWRRPGRSRNARAAIGSSQASGSANSSAQPFLRRRVSK
jgi:hypothetical protein